MTRFQRAFLVWFLVLLLFFLFANLYPEGSNYWTVRSFGFPLVCARSALGTLSYLDPFLLGCDVLIAVSVSALVAALCAWARWRSFLDSLKKGTTLPKDFGEHWRRNPQHDGEAVREGPEGVTGPAVEGPDAIKGK